MDSEDHARSDEEGSESEQPRDAVKPKRRKLRAVRVVFSGPKQVMVEWEGKGYILPPSCVVKGKVSEEDLETASPYGTPWEDVIQIPSPHDIAKELRRRGIWTYEDLVSDPSNAREAFLVCIYKPFLAATAEWHKRVRAGR